MSRLVKWVMGIFVCCAINSGAHATYTNNAVISVGGVYAAGQICHTGPQTSAAGCSLNGLLDPNHGGASIQANSSAFGDATGLHAFASETTSASPYDPSTYSLLTNAQVGLQDWFSFTGTHPFSANITMTITTHGSATGGGSFGYTQVDMGDQHTFISECYFNNAGSCTVHGLVLLSIGFGLSMDLIAEAILQGAGSAVAGFADTAYVSSLQFTDANGNPLNLSYTTASGLTYPMAQPGTVPEPATLALLGLGLAGLGFSRRKH